jgi:hypothetical protein
MAITNGYCTLAELKEVLGRSDTAKDTFLEACVERASRFIDNYTDRFYYSKSITAEKLDIYSISETGFKVQDNYIYCPTDIISVTTLASDGVALVADTGYWLYKNKIELASYATTTHKGISFTGSVGYASTPLAIKQACLTISEVFSGLGIRTVVDGDGNDIDIVKNSLPSWVMKFLEKERFAIC